MLIFADAKINLGLNVLERLDNGYHAIDTVMYHVGWRDIIEAVEAVGDKSQLTLSGRTVECPPEKNLVTRAYQAMRELFGIPATDIYLHKIIPDGAGLGGGSSDAVNTLKLLRDMYCREVSDEQLATMAGLLGADCPFFVYDKPMRATGIGTDLAPVYVDIIGYVVALVKIDKSVSTREAYSGVTPHVPEQTASEIVASVPIEQWRDCLVNDFERSVFALLPELADIKAKLYESGAIYASMSGSGSTIYGLFGSETDVHELRNTLHAKWPDASIFVDVLC